MTQDTRQRIVPTFVQFISEASSYTWQRPGEHFKAGAGILAISAVTKRILLVMRAPADGDQDAGKWSMVGGMMNDEEMKVNADKGSRDAALREFKEETGQDDPFDKLIKSYEYRNPDGSFVYYNYIGLVSDEFEPVLDHENSAYRWFSIADLKKIPRDQFHFGVKLLFSYDESHENVIKENAA